VNVASLVELVVAGLKDTVTPLGRFVALKLTVGAEPSTPFTLILSPTLEPIARLMVPAELDKVKPDCGTFNTSAVVFTSDPEVPVTVTA